MVMKARLVGGRAAHSGGAVDSYSVFRDDEESLSDAPMAYGYRGDHRQCSPETIEPNGRSSKQTPAPPVKSLPQNVAEVKPPVQRREREAQKQPAPRKLLTTWGEIAGRLRVSVSTAQRWHQRHGLPVSKAGGAAAQPQARVVCDADELDKWARRFYRRVG